MKALPRGLALPLALVLPPVGLWLRRGPGRGFALNVVLVALALLVYRLAAAGPGLALWGLAVVQALVPVLRPDAPPLPPQHDRIALPALWGLALLAAMPLPGGGTPSPQDPGRPDPATLARGQRLAEACRACHALTSPGLRIGPPLLGVVGRAAGTVPDYAYSPGLKEAGFTWEPELIVSYVADPLTMVPGTKMAMAEMTMDEAADVVTWLQWAGR